MNVAACYFSYLAISIGLTIWVARTLHQNGRVFLVDAFRGNTELADSVNHLLVELRIVLQWLQSMSHGNFVVV